jgi:hypothetical protein
VSEENIKIENFEGRIPLEQRNIFQIFLMGELGVKHGDYKSQENWVKNAKEISNIIDDEENVEIRNFIMRGKNKEASDLIINKLKQTKLV